MLKFRKKSPTQSIMFSDGKLFLDHVRETGGWRDLYYGNVQTLADLIGAKQVIEVGVAHGLHAEDLLNNRPRLSYIGIDPYNFGYDPEDHFCSAIETSFGLKGQEAMDKLFVVVKENLSKFGNRATLFREDSINYTKKLGDNSCQLVFLDGDHRYEYVKNEIAIWWDKISPGGVLCGDDFWIPGVEKAVKEFANLHSLNLRFVSKNAYLTWFFQKAS